VFVATGMLLASFSHAVNPYAIAYERNVPVRMRDGVELRADIYRPDAEGKFPVLLQRTPYDKDNAVAVALKAASLGYVVIIEDVRGRYASEGEWYPFKNEQNDGYDTVEWAAGLTYSTGKVGMFGGSYVGATQMLAAIAHPPHLAGICPFVTGSNYHDNWTYQGGAFDALFSGAWTSDLAQDTFSRAVKKHTNALNGIRSLPLFNYPLFDFQQKPAQSTSSLAPYYLDWLDHPSYDDFWKRVSIEEHFPDIIVPALHVGAWYDLFLGGSLRNYMGIKAHGGNEEARRGQRLWVAVGGHAGNGPKIGALDFGQASKVDDNQIMLDWYDYLFKGVQNEFDSGKRVMIFVMGINRWRQEDDWPLARAKSTRYYLHSTGTANGLAAGGSERSSDGSLSVVAPAAEKPDHYVYDPNDPVQTVGGPVALTGAGPQDQRQAESRNDVLVYTTPSFAKDTEVTGPLSLDLYVSTSAVDTDFTGMLVDVWPNGFTQNLTSGILRLRYRQSQEKPEPANPGETYHITLDLWATSNVFLAGHKLRLEVSSSNFPRYDRNLNTGEEQARATGMVKATNVIYHDKARPSALIVPIVP
jgi:uncharacterized protein